MQLYSILYLKSKNILLSNNQEIISLDDVAQNKSGEKHIRNRNNVIQPIGI